MRTAVLVDYRLSRVLEVRLTDLAPPRLVCAVEEAWSGATYEFAVAEAIQVQ